MSGWDDALSVVAKLAPTIGAVLGGPLLGGGISALESVFGLTPASTASTDDRTAALASAISGATPDQLLAMKKADQDYAVQMATLGFKDTESLASLNVQDRVSARLMQTETKSYTAPALAIFITLGFFSILAAMMLIAIPPAAHDALMLMLGALGTAWISVVSFYFGSSAGSQKKDALLANSTPAI
jgi:hypothetical protein